MKILFFGDSITDMARSRDTDGQDYGYGVGYVNSVGSTLKYENPEKYGAIHYLYDGVHPDLAGGKLIAEEWLKVFRKEI